MDSGKEASVHIQLEGRPSILEMVSLWYSGNFVDKISDRPYKHNHLIQVGW